MDKGGGKGVADFRAENVFTPVRAFTAQGQLPLYELSMLVVSGLSSSLPSRFASVGNSLPNRM